MRKEGARVKKCASRRSFMKSALAAGVFPLLPGCFSHRGYIANSKVRLACCGVGGMGGVDVNSLFATGLCDIVAIPAKRRLSAMPRRMRCSPLFRGRDGKIITGCSCSAITAVDHDGKPCAA